ncbi:MAG: type II toxin-antitoxin system HicA family toxin [Lachnospiraceae bacterium]|nr:type II toxin-antitoxin system HicA family toxin [Lachnospiraceae bacterium]
MPITSREMINYLVDNGFRIVNQTGSHVKLKNKETGKYTTVPFHRKDLAKGLEHSILKQAGLKKGGQ